MLCFFTAPAKALDVWYTTSNSPNNSITLHWKVRIQRDVLILSVSLSLSHMGKKTLVYCSITIFIYYSIHCSVYVDFTVVIQNRGFLKFLAESVVSQKIIVKLLYLQQDSTS